MNQAQLASYEQAFAELGQTDLLALAGRLIDLARARGTEPLAAPTDLSEFYGTVRFPEDGLEYQQRVRNEWT